MIGKRNLRSCVVLLEKTNQILEEKNNSANSALDKKENLLNKKYNLRKCGSLEADKINKSFNHESVNDIKKLSNKNVKEISKDVCMKGGTIKGKENEIKRRSKRQVVKQNNSIKIESQSSLNLIKGKLSGTFEDKNKISKFLSVNKKLREEKSNISREDDKNTNGKFPLNEISKFHSKKDAGQKNVIVNKISVENKTITNHTAKIPIWRKNVNRDKPKRGTKRKSFVDIYDISQDEDMATEIKHKKNKLNTQKNVKRCINKKKYPTVSIKNAKFIQKYSYASKPIQNRPIILDVNQYQSNTISSKLIEMQINNTSSDKKLKSVNTAATVDKNSQNCVFSTPDEVNDVISEHMSFDDVSAEPKFQDNKKNHVLKIADELEKSLLMPIMTSTPDYAVLVKTKTQTLQGNVPQVLDVSHIISQNRKCLNGPIDPSQLKNKSIKEIEISLFESPVKKQENKKPVIFKSPKKSVQSNLFQNFITPPRTDNLEDSILKPRKAYHTPDNFKTHLARTKRISEVIKKKPKKSKADIMAENMNKHFDDISGTELCIV